MKKPETICRRLCANNGIGAGGCPDCDEIDGCQTWPDYHGDLRTVLNGLQEPTAGQLEAGRRAAVNATWSWQGGTPKARDLKTLALDIWVAMVDEINEENANAEEIERGQKGTILETAADGSEAGSSLARSRDQWRALHGHGV